MSLFTPRIAIIGAGPSGLALSLLLHQHSIPSTIFDLRSKPTPESLATPSGMLDLHEESGLTAIRACNLWSKFQSALGDCSEDQKIMTPDGTIVHTDEGEGSRPEISRNALTSMLLEGLPAETIQWGTKVLDIKSVKNDSTGAEEVQLDIGGNLQTFDFVVGADGAWSRVRRVLISDAKPMYTGAQLVTVTARNVTRKYPHLAELNGTGSLSALGGGKAILTHRGPMDSIRAYAAVRTDDEDWAEKRGLKTKTSQEVGDVFLNDAGLFASWAPHLKDLLSTCCIEDTKDNTESKADILPLYILPTEEPWRKTAAATIIGDAAHLITPFAGEGVNLALWDALDLSQVLATVAGASNVKDWQTALEPTLREFERTMRERAKEKAEESVRNQNMMLSDNGAQQMVDVFRMYGMEG